MTTSLVPVGVELGYKLPCAHCGDALHEVADEQLDEFVWVDDAGGRLGTDSDLRQFESCGGAYAHLKWLADEMDRLHGLCRKGKHGDHWPDGQVKAEYFERGREYSALKVRLDMGMTFHVHRAAVTQTPDYAGELPYCCGWPAWLRPSGWQCRQCKLPVPFP